MEEIMAKKVEVKSIEAMINEKIVGVIENLLICAKKFDGGNNSAGSKTRKALQEIKVSIKEIRDEVTAIKNGRKS
jgi:hypothetical protein